MRELAWYNGKLTSIEEATVSAGDRAFYFGDGIYDVASVRKKVCFALDDHLDRFMKNAELLRLNLGMNKEELRGLCQELISHLDEDVTQAALYFQASRATAPRAHSFPENAKANLYFTLKPTTFAEFGKPVTAIFEEDTRFLMCHIKTLNLLPNVLASQKATEAGCYEAIFHRGERVTDCSHSGVSYLKDGVFCTPPVNEYILPSISRKHYLELCEKENVPVKIAPFTKADLLAADEVIIMSTTSVMCRCTSIDGIPVGGKDEATLRKLAIAYKNKILSDTEK